MSNSYKRCYLWFIHVSYAQESALFTQLTPSEGPLSTDCIQCYNSRSSLGVWTFWSEEQLHNREALAFVWMSLSSVILLCCIFSPPQGTKTGWVAYGTRWITRNSVHLRKCWGAEDVITIGCRQVGLPQLSLKWGFLCWGPSEEQAQPRGVTTF